MTLLTPLWMQAAIGDPPLPYSATQDRGLIDTIATAPGVVLGGDLRVSQRAAGANMSVDVAAGSAFVAGGAVAGQGKYLCQSTSVINVPVSPAPGAGTRTDLVVAQVNDKQSDGGPYYNWNPVVLAGTATVPAGMSAIPLATIAVAAGVVSIVAANITDARPFATSFSSVAVAPTYSSLPANPRQGDQGFLNDTKIHTIFDGGTWRQFTPSVAGYFFGSTDANGYLTIPMPANLDWVPTNLTIVIVGIITTNVGGGVTIPMSAIVDQNSIGPGSFRVRVFNTTGAPYVSTGITISYLLRR